MRVGFELLDLARAAGASSIFVVGTGRDVGKTTALRAIYDAARGAGLSTAIASLNPEHRLWLYPQTAFVTARNALPSFPAAEILDFTRLQSPTGRLLYARTASSGRYELVGPPTASGVREIVAELSRFSEAVIVDGAVDRVAALAGSNGAIVVAAGAASAKTMQEAVDEVAALVTRLSVPRADPHAPAIEIQGALTSAQAVALLAAGERRQIVVRDPTQIALSGNAATGALGRLAVRCLRPLRVIAATVASISPERAFEPRAFARAVADSTGLPTFDVYAGTRAA
ncbi:MAG: hypothetical protein JOZ77_10815 [Candidatus Eremiobacteraeota bacterium]|nr:hypothetical protein [Candidatus Eremiobacteraeota bacterium]